MELLIQFPNQSALICNHVRPGNGGTTINAERAETAEKHGCRPARRTPFRSRKRRARSSSIRCGIRSHAALQPADRNHLRSLDPAVHRLSPQETSVDDGSPGDHGVPVVAGDRPTRQLIDAEPGVERRVVSLSRRASHRGWRHRAGTQGQAAASRPSRTQCPRHGKSFISLSHRRELQRK